MRQSREGRVMNAPYFADVEPWDGALPDLSESFRNHRLRELQDFESDLTSEGSDNCGADEISILVNQSGDRVFLHDW